MVTPPHTNVAVWGSRTLHRTPILSWEETRGLERGPSAPQNSARSCRGPYTRQSMAAPQRGSVVRRGRPCVGGRPAWESPEWAHSPCAQPVKP